MSAEIREDRTKHGLEIALQEMLKRKPLDQIRVRELTELCDIRRQSFYYHFSDVYALFDWSLQRERARLLRRQENCLTWQQALRDLLAYIGERQSYYQALLQSRGRAGLREVVEDAVAQLLEKTMELLPAALRRARGPGGGADTAGLLGDDLPGAGRGLGLGRPVPDAGRAGQPAGEQREKGGRRRHVAVQPAVESAELKTTQETGKDRGLPVLSFYPQSSFQFMTIYGKMSQNMTIHAKVTVSAVSRPIYNAP